MGEDEGRTALAETREPSAIRDEIVETRAELGDTVAALSRKTDVKARAKEKVEDARQKVTKTADDLAAKAESVLPPAARKPVANMRAGAGRRPFPARAALVIGAVTAVLVTRRRGAGKGRH